jgi:DNA-binding MarR family transcriptional regulator
MASETTIAEVATAPVTEGATATRAGAADGAASDDLLALQNQVCFALAVASRSVIALYRPILEPLGLTHPQYLVMLSLWEQSPRSVSSIGRALQLEPATLSPLLKRLEASGYVERARDPHDERMLRVGLTQTGRLLRDRALGIPPKIIDRLGMDLAELADLRIVLHRVIQAATEPADA